MSKILITGATGKLGSEVINLLLLKTDKNNISALVRNTSKAEELKNKGVEIIQGDYDDYSSLLKAFSGIDKLYFISSSDIQNRLVQQERVVNAAKEAGVNHIIYTSFVRKNETETSPIAKVAEAHIKTEKLLKDSGLNYTILKHNLYMDLLPIFMGEKVLETKTIYLPAGSGKTAFTFRSDMARVGAEILVSSGHENKEYIISAEKKYSLTEIAEIMSSVTGEVINYVSPTQEEFTSTLKEAGVPEEYIWLFSNFSEAIKQGEFEETSNSIETITGKTSTPIENFLKEVYSK